MLPLAAQAGAPLELMTNAQQAFEQGQYDEALTLYEQAHDESEGDLSVLYNAAVCRMSLGQPDEAIRTFEDVAANANVSTTLEADALFSIGVLRSTQARGRLQQLLSPSTQPAHDTPTAQTQPTEEQPVTLPIEDLESVAADLLTAIDFFRKARDAGAVPDEVEHNIRAVRATRREVLGLIRQAREAAAEKEKEEALEDPNAYLATLISEQKMQAAVSRRLARRVTERASQQRRERRVALRLQRATMDRTDTLVDHLERFTESADEEPAATQPASESPREQVYHEAAKRLAPALERQRDACAYLLDGELTSTREQQLEALEAMREAEMLFPLDPTQALARWHGEERGLSELVKTFGAPADWQRDPLLPPDEHDGATSQPASQPADLAPTDIPIYDTQEQIGRGLARLTAQARAIATHAPAPTSAPAGAPGQPPDPRTDPELNKRLAEVLATAQAPQARCLTAIAETDKNATASAQEEISEIIIEALDLFPKSLEQRLRELIVRQAGLNGEVAGAAEAGDDSATEEVPDKSSLRRLADGLLSRLKSLIASPATLAETMADKQTAIETDTRSVEEEVKQQATSAAGQQGGAQSPQVQAFIEAGRHLSEADRQMLAAVEELKQAAVEATLNRLAAEGPVQTTQKEALEALIKALEALNPKQDEDQQDQDDQQQQEQQQQQQQRQDIRRAMERLNKQREEAEQKLYRGRPKRAIKDW